MTTPEPAPNDPENFALYDPENDDRVTTRRLRGLAHPLRLRIMQLLRTGGAATCTLLAAELDQSTASVSHHLSKLAEGGFIAIDTEHPTRGREKWWKAVHRTTWFNPDARIEEVPGGTEYLSALAERSGEEMRRYIDRLPETPLAWQQLATLSRWRFRLTPDEVRAFNAELSTLMSRLRRDGDGPVPDDAVAVTFQTQLLPEPDEDAR